MLTNDINEVNNYIEKTHKYASIVYNKMVSQRYGVKPCKSCGDTDNIGIYNIHLLEYEKLKLNELLDGDCSDRCNCRCDNHKEGPCCGKHDNCCNLNLVSFEEINKMINGYE